MLWRKFSNPLIQKQITFAKGAVMKVTSTAGVVTSLDMAEIAALNDLGATDLQKIDGIKSVLLPVCLCLHDMHFFGQPVGRIGFFGIARPEILFAKWCWSVLWVRANSPHIYKLFHSFLARRFNEMDAHERVVIKKLAGFFAV